MHDFTRDYDTPESRARRIERLKKLTDAELIRAGRQCAFLARPGTKRAIWAEQLEECRAEWRRRAVRGTLG